MRLDHIGILVPSLAEAAEFCARLGFTLTRRAAHTRIGADGRIEIVSREQLPAAISASPWPARAWVCAALLAVEDPAAFAAQIRALDCAVAASPRGPILDLRAQLGCLVILQQAA